MDFNEKIQILRKQRGLTQEELAEILFVSRTAVSKWESGRGYPNLDSLKALAGYFGVTIDELLSGDELLTLAEDDNRKKEDRLRDLVSGLLDCSVVMFFFLPFFGQERNAEIQAVTLLRLTEIEPYLRIAYFAAVIGMVASGIAHLTLQNCQAGFWMKHKQKLSLAINLIGSFLFMISLQPYAAALLSLFLIVKGLLLLKR